MKSDPQAIVWFLVNTLLMKSTITCNSLVPFQVLVRLDMILWSHTVVPSVVSCNIVSHDNVMVTVAYCAVSCNHMAW